MKYMSATTFQHTSRHMAIGSFLCETQESGRIQMDLMLCHLCMARKLDGPRNLGGNNPMKFLERRCQSMVLKFTALTAIGKITTREAVALGKMGLGYLKREILVSSMKKKWRRSQSSLKK